VKINTNRLEIQLKKVLKNITDIDVRTSVSNILIKTFKKNF